MMNFTPELSAFQGAILSADNVYKFAKLNAKGGNEDEIEYVVESLKRFLEENRYLTLGKVLSVSVSAVRKFALYLILNADLPELQQLVELDELGTLIGTSPTIPKCLLCELMWNLDMDKFIFEVICFANPQLGLEVAGAFINNFKYLDPLDCRQELYLLSSACYILICRLHLFNFETTELENKAKAAFDSFQQLMKHYTTLPECYNWNSIVKVDVYKYQGQKLYSMLQLIDECLTQFTSKLDNTEAFSVYTLTYEEESMKKDLPTFNICESSNNILLECLNKVNLAMLDACKVLVMDVSVEVFCCWSEIEENNKSMQQTVGEMSYKVHNKLLGLNVLAEHPLVSMLEQISRKPVEMNCKINATEDAVIIQNINNNNEESREWIKALVNKEKLCGNLELLDIVNSNLNSYNEEESYQLYLLFKKYISQDLDNRDYVELLSIKAFEKCDNNKKRDILEQQFNNKKFVDMKITPQFKNAMTSIFNKLIASPDADLNDVLTVFLQNPYEVFTKIFLLASENMQQTNIMLKVMNLLKNFSEHYYSTETEACIIQVSQKTFDDILTEAQENNYINFICGLKNTLIIPGTKLLLQIIMTNIHQALLSKEIGKLNVQMKLLQKAYQLEELMVYRAPMLAMLAQVLNVARWKVNTFSANAPSTLNLAIDLQTSLINTYNGVIPDNQKEWLKSKLRNLMPLNVYYYKILWNPPGFNYLETISGLTVSDDINMDELTSWLSQVICSCTQDEWCEIWNSLTVIGSSMIYNIIHAAIAMLTIAEKSNRTENSWPCILYCYRNFMYITRYKYLTEPPTDLQVQSILSKAAMIAELVREENIEEYGTALMPLFAYLTEKQSNYEINFVECLNENLAHTKLAAMMKKVFVNGTV